MQPTRSPIWTLARLKLTNRQQLVYRIFQLLFILKHTGKDEPPAHVEGRLVEIVEFVLIHGIEVYGSGSFRHTVGCHNVIEVSRLNLDPFVKRLTGLVRAVYPLPA